MYHELLTTLLWERSLHTFTNLPAMKAANKLMRSAKYNRRNTWNKCRQNAFRP